METPIAKARQLLWFRQPGLLLKQIIEGRTSIRGSSRRDLRRRVRTHSVRAVPAGNPVPGDGHSGREEATLIGRVLHRDALWDWFQTLESCRGLKVSALLTAMQRNATLWAIPPKISVCR